MAVYEIIDLLLVVLFYALIACGFVEGGFKMYGEQPTSHLPPRPGPA